MGSLVDQGLAARKKESFFEDEGHYRTILTGTLCCSWLITDSNSDEFYSSISGSEESGSEEE